MMKAPVGIEERGSRIEGFCRMGHRARLAELAARAGLRPDEVANLERSVPLPFEVADNMIENAIGVVGLPLGVALNFRINGLDRFVPMAVEEPSEARMCCCFSMGAGDNTQPICGSGTERTQPTPQAGRLPGGESPGTPA